MQKDMVTKEKQDFVKLFWGDNVLNHVSWTETTKPKIKCTDNIKTGTLALILSQYSMCAKLRVICKQNRLANKKILGE